LPDLLHTVACVLVAASEELDRPDGAVPANVRHVGPLTEAPGADASWAPPWADDSTPLVHACTSTIAPTELAVPVLQRVLDATAELPVHVLMTATDEVRDALQIPANAVVVPYVRHSALLPHVDVFVTHAGLSSIGAAMTSGVPMVCMPLFNEQPENAEHARVLGVARVVAPDAPVEEIRECINAALADDQMRRTAARVASDIARSTPHVRATRALAGLIP
jgi:UDP:flavonoid glycosyltransferase YjiC (YdhE family)